MSGLFSKRTSRRLLASTLAAGAVAAAGVAFAGPAQASPVKCTNAGTKLDFGQGLHEGKCIYSPSGAFVLVMQGDGNLVTYNSNTGASCWDSGTAGKAYQDANVGKYTVLPANTVQISLIIEGPYVSGAKVIKGSTEPASTYQNITVNNSGYLFVGYQSYKTRSC